MVRILKESSKLVKFLKVPNNLSFGYRQKKRK